MQDGLRAELLDIREAAALLRVSETSLRRWTNAGRLPCLRVGGRRERRFRRADLLAFLSGEGATGHSPSRSHFCGLYTSDLSRVREAAAFLAGGLQPRTLSMLVAAPDVQRAVIELLERDRPATRNDLETGRLTLAEYRDSAPAQLEYWGTVCARHAKRERRACRSWRMSRAAGWAGCHSPRFWNTRPSMNDPSHGGFQ